LEIIKELDPNDVGCIEYDQMKLLLVYSLYPDSPNSLSSSFKKINVKYLNIQEAISDIGKSEVRLHIYDLPNLKDVNDYTMSSLKLGAFHTGIEVYGYEWSFANNSGIFSCDAGQSPIGTFRATVELGRTSYLDNDMVINYLVSIKENWASDSYDIITHNCNHFCNELALELVKRKLPKSVMRLVKFAKMFKGIIPTTLLIPEGQYDDENGNDMDDEEKKI